MYSCGWKSLSAYNPAPKEIRKDCHRQSSWKGFRFLLEDSRVAQMLPLTGAWIQACHLKRTIYKFNSVNMQSRLGQIQAVVTNALAKQRYKRAIYIFTCYMDPKTCSSTLFPHTLLLILTLLPLPVISASWLPHSLHQSFRFPTDGALKLHCQPFSQPHHPHANVRQKTGRKQRLGARTCKYL